jgi:pyridoxal phosphate enzyme (YggS family)
MGFKTVKYKEIEDFIKKSNKKTKIVAISKNHPIEEVINAIKSGVTIFGENKVQEAQSKFLDLKREYNNLELHLTGPLQTNKVKSALELFDCFQTIDREKLVKEFKKHLSKIREKKFFIQVNIGNEENKSGISPIAADEFIKYFYNELKIEAYGLMCIPPNYHDPEPYFLELKKIAQRNNIKNLSMGMSADYKIGIVNDATYIRVGTILFGEREIKKI